MVKLRSLKSITVSLFLIAVFQLHANFSDRVDDIRYHYSHGQIFSAFFKVSELPDSSLTDIDLLMKENIFHDYAVFTRQPEIYLQYFSTLDTNFVYAHFSEVSDKYNNIFFSTDEYNILTHFVLQRNAENLLSEEQWAILLLSAYKYGKMTALNDLLQYMPVLYRLNRNIQICLAYCFAKDNEFLKSSVMLDNIKIPERENEEINLINTSQLISSLTVYNIINSENPVETDSLKSITDLDYIIISFYYNEFPESLISVIDKIPDNRIQNLLFAFFHFKTGEPILAYDHIRDLDFSNNFSKTLKNKIVLAIAEEYKKSNKLREDLKNNLESFDFDIPVKKDSKFSLNLRNIKKSDELSLSNMRKAISELDKENDIFMNENAFLDKLYLDDKIIYDYSSLKTDIHDRLKTGDYDRIIEKNNEFTKLYSLKTDSLYIYNYIAFNGLQKYDEAFTELSELTVNTKNDSLKKIVVYLLPQIVSRVSLENGADNLELLINDPVLKEYKSNIFKTLAGHYENYNLFDMANRIYILCLSDSICTVNTLLLSKITENMIKLKDYSGAIHYFSEFSDSLFMTQEMKLNLFIAFHNTEQPDSAMSIAFDILNTTDVDSLNNEVLLNLGNFFYQLENWNLSLIMYEIFLDRKYNVLNDKQTIKFEEIKRNATLNVSDVSRVKSIKELINKEIERIRK